MKIELLSDKKLIHVEGKPDGNKFKVADVLEMFSHVNNDVLDHHGKLKLKNSYIDFAPMKFIYSGKEDIMNSYRYRLALNIQIDNIPINYQFDILVCDNSKDLESNIKQHLIILWESLVHKMNEIKDANKSIYLWLKCQLYNLRVIMNELHDELQHCAMFRITI